MSSLICTLFEGHYHIGAAALLNSLHKAGFNGDFVCGHRGPVPPWAPEAARLAPAIRVHWLECPGGVHLTNHKPAFLLQCIQTFDTGAAGPVFYLDPDIVVKAPWELFERWARDGIALVEDLNASLPAGHPYRLRWHDLYARRGRAPARRMERYHNAGFIGLPSSRTDFLSLWAEIVGWAAAEGAGLASLKNKRPHDLFHSADQDALNMALELCTTPLNAAGPEAMDFVPGGHLLSHAAGGLKPWRGGFLREALRGRPPGAAQKCFHDHVDAPLRVLPPGLAFRRRLALKLASFLGRFYSRR